MPKAKIQTSFGSFEFEGDEQFVQDQIKTIFQKIDISQDSSKKPNESLTENSSPIQNDWDNSASSENDFISVPNNDQTAAKTKQNRKKTIQDPKIITNLNFDKIKLQEFLNEKRPSTHEEKFACFAYWLKSNLDISEVSIDEMWTVYKILNMRPPRVLIQVFRDGKRRKVWFDNGSKPGYYHLTSYGETFVEHDLPHKILQTNSKEG